jgi:hypothetical protein
VGTSALHAAVIGRAQLDSFECGGRLDDGGPEERWIVECDPFGFRSRTSNPIVIVFATRGSEVAGRSSRR